MAIDPDPDPAAEPGARARPDYPQAALSAVFERVQAGPGRHLVDLGAGTGELTIPLLERGATLTAVEPVVSLGEGLEAAVPSGLQDALTIVDAPAESLPLADAVADGATAAQAFHWFDPRPALRELHRILRPRSWLAVLHNRRDLTTPAQAAIDEMLAHHGDAASRFDSRWSRPLEDPDGFAPAELLTFPHGQTLHVPDFIARVTSGPFVAQLGEPERQAVLAAARGVFGDLVEDDVVHLDYVAEVRFLQRLAS